MPVYAATFTVTNLKDSGSGSLRQAVLDASASLTATHTIEFQPGLTGTIALVNGEIEIKGRMTINGPGENVLAISGNQTSRVFNVNSLAATISGLTIKDGKADYYGGGISNSGYLTLSNLTLSDNDTSSGGGGIYNSGYLTLSDIILSDNQSAGEGGGISNGGSLTATRLTLSGNAASSYGGGIATVSTQPVIISDSLFTGNHANSNGGGINSSGGTLTIANSVFTNNRADSSNGGGGIASGDSTLTVTHSTLSGNETPGSGGGILTYGGTLTVTNSTLSGNAANGYGGGIKTGYTTLTIINSTLTGNMAISGGGGIYNYGSLSLNNSIVAGNIALTGKEISGGYSTESSYNLFGENGVSGVDGATPSPGEIIAGSLSSVIGSLADNGGSTQTHALVAGSPAIDAGDNSLIPASITTDQRNQPRIQNGTVDIGAVEGTGGSSISTYVLMVGKSGGNGTITSNPSGINCGSTCTGNFNSGTSVTLTANPNNGYSFSGWSGDCSGTSKTCTVAMNAAKNVTAMFANVSPDTYILTVSNVGAGSGTVTSNPSGIDCGTECSASYSANTVVTLTATTGFQDGLELLSTNVFAGWSGDCSGTSETCTVTMDQARNVTALFTNVSASTFTLTTAKTGNGSGTVSGAGSYAAGATVKLTATPSTGSTFVGWSPSPCATSFAMPANALACTATFNSTTSSGSQLTVALAGTGVGSVVSQPSGIRCSNAPGTAPDCSESYTANTQVTLTATPAIGPYYFAGWSGACSGTGTCTVTLSAAQSVTATFATGYALTVNTQSGTVTRNPAGSNCTRSDFDEQCIYAPSTVVTLTAIPNAGLILSGWGGACVGTGTCQVTMNAHQRVAAGFTINDPVTRLISHYYVSILERAPEPAGLAFWQGQVAERQAQGEDAKPVFRQLAQQFFSSEEYVARNTTDRQFITNLYLTFFQRKPDEAGINYWLAQLTGGMPRNDAMNGFLHSPEFTAFMEAVLNP